METNSRLAWQLLAGILVVLLAIGVCLPLFGRKAVRGPQTMSLLNAKQLATGCKLYAVDHEGRFPVHLSELEPDYVVSVKELRGMTHGPDEKPEYRYDWLYFGAGFTEDKPPTVFLASPQLVAAPSKQKRMVICGDTSGNVMSDAEYEKLLAETVRQMRELDDRNHPTKSNSVASPAK